MNENDSAKNVILEGMTSISALLDSRSVNDRKIIRVWIDAERASKRADDIRFLETKKAELGFAIEYTDAKTVGALSTGTTHGGILAECGARTVPPLTADQILPNGFYVYLEGMEDPYNFGGALRSLYAAGVCGVVLPERNWLNAAGTVARASAGASERLAIFRADAQTTVSAFRMAGYQILCAGIRNSVSIFENTFSYPLLLVIGGEKRGISRIFLENADKIVRVDYGNAFRGSLSSSASAAVLAFELFRQNRK